MISENKAEQDVPERAGSGSVSEGDYSSRPTGSGRRASGAAVDDAPSDVHDGTAGTAGAAGTAGTAGTAGAAGSVAQSSSGSHAATGDTASLSTSELAVRPPASDAERRAAERDQAVSAKPVLARVLQVLVAVFFPIIVIAAAIRAVTSPLFLWFEYNRPGFPADRFGFDQEERMTYASYTMDYLLNFAGPEYLGGLVDAGGDPLFATDEVGHMADVKMVIQLTFLAALILALVSVISIIYLARRYPGGVRRALFAGAVVTLVLIGVVAVLAALGWQRFFAAFHSVFFADGTWTFAADDTLIRLFPGQFWIDAGIAVAAVILIISAVTLLATWPTKRRRSVRSS